MTEHSADQGLLVAWGGINGPAQREIRTDRLTLAVWDGDEIVTAYLPSATGSPTTSAATSRSNEPGSSTRRLDDREAEVPVPR
jgi:hypothetical protein